MSPKYHPNLTKTLLHIDHMYKHRNDFTVNKRIREYVNTAKTVNGHELTAKETTSSIYSNPPRLLPSNLSLADYESIFICEVVLWDFQV